MDYQNLKNKPLWQMTGEEFLQLTTQSGAHNATTQPSVVIDTTKKRHVYGI